MAEQLYFTWADRGLEGRGMWQIVAATERLFERLSIARRQARELCTRFSYPPLWRDPETAPVSFGWRDIDGLRYAFRRVYTGTDLLGRPGVFAAHVLVDRPERLPASSLLDRADSATWWGGAPFDGGDWLPPVSLDAFKPPGSASSATADDEVTTAVLTAVLAHGGRPVLLAIDTALLVSALRRVAHLLPGVLDDLGVSTYEPPGTRGDYGLAATLPPDDDPMAIPVEVLLEDAGVALPRRIARLALEPDVRSRSYVGHAWDATREAGTAFRASFLGAGKAFLALRGPADPRPEELLPALRAAGTAADLLDDPRARATVARALGAGDARTVEALRGVGHGLDAATWSALGRLAAEAATTPAGLAVAWRLLTALSAEGADELVARVVGLAAADPARVRRWPVDVLPDACRRREVRESPPLRAAVIGAGARHLLALASAPRMPADLWAPMLAEALRTRAVDVGHAARAVAANEARARAAGTTLPAADLQRLSEALPPADAFRALSWWAAPERADVWIDLAARLAHRLGDAEAWRPAAVVAGALTAFTSTRWATLRDQVLRRRLNHELDDARAPRCALLGVVQRDTGPAGRAWREYLRLTTAAEPRPRHARLLAARLADLPSTHRALARRHALHDAVTRALTVDDVAEAVHELSGPAPADPAETAELVLRAGARATLALQHSAAGVSALLYVAVCLVEPQAVRTKRNGELLRPAAHDAALRLYLALLPRERDLALHCAAWATGRPRAERWLRGLHPGAS